MASALAWALRSQSQSASALSRPPLFQRETGKGYSAADSTAAYVSLVVVSDVVADQSEDATAEEAATVGQRRRRNGGSVRHCRQGHLSGTIFLQGNPRPLAKADSQPLL